MLKDICHSWCSGESCLIESPGRGFKAASPQILRGEGLPRFFSFPDPTHVGASGTGSALFFIHDLSKSIVIDREQIFTSHLCQELS